MKKLLPVLMAIALAFMSVSCFDEDGGLEFAGTWVYDSTKKADGYVETLVMSEADFSFAASGGVAGSAFFSVTSYDVDLNHIEAVCTGTSAAYSYVETDTYYFTYDIDFTVAGEVINIDSNSDEYPDTAGTAKPYVKQ